MNTLEICSAAWIWEVKDSSESVFQFMFCCSMNRMTSVASSPFSSLKYHILLACAIYYNLKNGINWHELYLAENVKNRSEFQVIYKDARREWALVPESGMSRVRLKFSETWDRRLENSIGGEDLDLEAFLSRLSSWSAALAAMENWYLGRSQYIE